MIVHKNTWVENIIEDRIMFSPRGLFLRKLIKKFPVKNFKYRSILKEKIVFAF